MAATKDQTTASGSALIRTLKEHVNYPPHLPRKPTALYTATHKRLIYELDTPCMVRTCAVTHSILSDPAKAHDPKYNPYGATALETHHHVLEDSLSEWADVDVFNSYILPHMREQHARHMREGRSTNPDKYAQPWTRESLLQWIHGDEDNMQVLCDCHHRSPLLGTHALTGPIFNAFDLIIPGADLTGFKAISPQEAQQLTALPLTVGEAKAP